MKPGDRCGRWFTVRSRLSSDPPSYLVNLTGRRQPVWVLKTFPLEKSDSLAQCLRPEMAELACLSHTALALPVSFGTDRQRNEGFVLRPFLEGSEAAVALRGLAPRSLYPWFLAIVESLEVLHRFGLLHRNLKSSNLIVPREGPGKRGSRRPRVVLCDPSFFREEGAEAGADGVTAPEVRRGERATFASDLYQLGAVLYQLLSGRALPGPDGLPVSPRE